jgi:hypothetical protein
MDDIDSVHWVLAKAYAAVSFAVGVGLIAGALAFG